MSDNSNDNLSTQELIARLARQQANTRQQLGKLIISMIIISK